MAKKKVTKTKAKKRKITSHDTHFLSVLLLFVGFSVYAISSFMNSTNNYIDQVLTDVLSSDGIVVQVDMDNPFSDVPGNAGYADAVIALYYDGVIGGYNDGTFRPDNSVTRAEFSKMLVEVNDFDYTDIPSDILSNCFTDVKDLPDHWYAPAVCAAACGKRDAVRVRGIGYEGWNCSICRSASCVARYRCAARWWGVAYGA